MAKLSDRQRKKLIAEYIEGGTSQRKLAEKYNVSPYLVRCVLREEDALSQKIAQKKEENTKSVLEYMDSKKDSVCELIDKLLEAMNDPEKIAATSLSQLATTMGIVIDKYTANETIRPDVRVSNNLFDAIRGCAKEAAFDDIPELQSEADGGADVVEQSDVSGQGRTDM